MVLRDSNHGHEMSDKEDTSTGARFGKGRDGGKRKQRSETATGEKTEACTWIAKSSNGGQRSVHWGISNP